MEVDDHILSPVNILKHFVLLLDKDLCIYMCRERIKNKSIVSPFCMLYSSTHIHLCVKLLNLGRVMSKHLIVCVIRGCDED